MGINVSKKDFSLNKVTTYNKVNNIKVDYSSNYEEIDYSTVEDSLSDEELEKILTRLLLSFLVPFGGIATVVLSIMDLEKIFKIKSVTSGGSSFDTIVETYDGYRYCFKNDKLVMIKDSKDNVYKVNEDGSITCAAYLNENLDIFNDDNNQYEQYGGNQMSFSNNNAYLLARDDIKNIISNYYPNITTSEMSLLLDRICSKGCGYTSIANFIFQKYNGKEQEFKNTFGFDMYRLDANGYIIYNYEPLITEIFLNYWTNKGNYTIEDLYSNTTGAFPYKLDGIFEKYGIDVEIYQNFYDSIDIFTKDNLQYFLDSGYTIIISTSGYNLYEYDSGNLASEDGGYHAMTLVGFTHDGRPIISSWGKKYIIDISNIDFSSGDYLNLTYIK